MHGSTMESPSDLIGFPAWIKCYVVNMLYVTCLVRRTSGKTLSHDQISSRPPDISSYTNFRLPRFYLLLRQVLVSGKNLPEPSNGCINIKIGFIFSINRFFW
jgi:hypothetical protein